MVFFNYATMQMAAKIVYYGPGLCGKTTNLHHIYAKTSPQSRGEMVSLETETDRTLFFDLLPIDVGVIGGFKTRLQLYTIPGQVFYNTTRKLVLKGVDGIVFVADSQKAMIEANVESFKNLRDNLGEIGVVIEDIPLVIQLNKRDLPNIADAETILDALDPERRYESVEAIAAKGDGVFETLKLISKLTLRTLRARMTGQDPTSKPKRTISDMSSFRVQGEGGSPAAGSRTVAGTTPVPAIGSAGPAASPSFTKPAAAASVAAAPAPVIEEAVEELESSELIEEPQAESFTDSTLGKSAADVDAHIISTAPVAAPTPPPEPEPVAAAPQPEPAPIVPPPVPEPEIDFSQTEKPAKAAPDVKHVKVRSSVDVMAELEALRKRATTQSAPKPAKKEAPAPAAPAAATAVPPPAPKPKRDIQQSMSMSVAPDTLPRSRRLRVTVSFESDDGVVQTQDQFVDLGETSDLGTISVNLKLES